jgi:hypothetical protein
MDSPYFSEPLQSPRQSHFLAANFCSGTISFGRRNMHHGKTAANRVLRLMAMLAMIAGVGGGLAGCTHAPPPPVYGDLSFDDQPKMVFALAKLQIVNGYTVPEGESGHIETQLPLSLPRTMARWASDRIQTVGENAGGFTADANAASPKKLVFKIVEASMRETPLAKKEQGLRGDFTNEQAFRYDATLSAVLEVRDGLGMKVAAAEASVSRSSTIDEKATLLDKERLWYNMTKAMMADLDKVLTSNIDQYLRRYLSNEP